MHLMIDLETLSTKNNAAITQIGVVAFEFNGIAPNMMLDLQVDPQTCIDAGLAVDWSTVKWWLTQGNDARMMMASGTGKPLRTALGVLAEAIPWWKVTGVWANGPSFDITILESAYTALGMKVPWQYRTIRDCRTMAMLRPDIKLVPPVIGHHAASDAFAQARWMQAIYDDLTKQAAPVAPAEPST